MEIQNKELYQQITDYILGRYSYLIKHEDYIWFGKASFSVKMLADCSYETLHNNPTKKMEEIVAFTFDYLCT
ncbi:MAG: hypothetical protein PHS59_01395 [Paludibacter sp.]|nr:hypothetical protein [Paludibacter sp.]